MPEELTILSCIDDYDMEVTVDVTRYQGRGEYWWNGIRYNDDPSEITVENPRDGNGKTLVLSEKQLDDLQRIVEDYFAH